jgi:hypothetical protein
MKIRNYQLLCNPDAHYFVHGLQPTTPCPKNLQNGNLKNIDFVDIMISKVLRDFPFS